LLVIGETALAYLMGLLAAEGLVALWALARLNRLYGLRLLTPGSGARMRELLRVGFPTLPGAVAALLLLGGDRFVITALLGLAATGVYALGQKLAESVVQILFIPFTAAFVPYALSMASKDQEQAFNLIGRSALVFAYLGGAIVGLPVILGREVILAFAGPEYAPAAPVFLLVTAGVLVFQLSQILGVYFSHTEQLRKYMWIIVVAAAGNLLLNLVVVRVAGIVGAAIVSLLMYEGVLIAMALAARRSGNPLVSLRRLHLPLLLFFTFLLLIFLVDSRGMDTIPAVLAKAALWAGYSAIGLALSREARSAITGIADRFRMLLAS
jgi:O-antigen/teichoic acid export membrane protein